MDRFLNNLKRNDSAFELVCMHNIYKRRNHMKRHTAGLLDEIFVKQENERIKQINVFIS